MKKKYYEQKKINLIEFLNKKDIEILKKFNIFIENRLYSEYEYDSIEEELFLYNKEDNSKNEILKVKKIKIVDYEKILKKFNRISSIYNL